MSFSNEVSGYWIFGRRDPDDLYSQRDIDLLRVLADQIAIALVNIEQARNLRALYQVDIDRQESERQKLARELHDDVLNRFAAFMMQIKDESFSNEIQQSYQDVADFLRSKIHDLRPPMLNYGLYPALIETIDETNERSGSYNKTTSKIAKNNLRYEENVELHLFRILQQAIENALEHSEAESISLSGKMEKNFIRLSVEDDGIGFDLSNGMNLVYLLENRHFGLAGMNERANLIGANLDIDSSPDQGTIVLVSWHKER
jgi:two-component system sensor histidine kinase DegS